MILKNKKLLLGLGAVAIASLPLLSTVSCGFVSGPSNNGGNNNNTDDDNNNSGGSNDNNGPVDNDINDAKEIIKELPKENFIDGYQLFGYSKLVKYVLEIPKITDESGQLISYSVQKQKYEEAIKYLTGSNGLNGDWSIKNTFYTKAYEYLRDYAFGSANGEFGDLTRDLMTKISVRKERVFQDDSQTYFDEFQNLIEEIYSSDAGTAYMVWTMVSDAVIQAQANLKIAMILANYCQYKIELINLRSVSAGVAKDLIKSKTSVYLKRIAQNLYSYFNPVQEKAAIQINSSNYSSDKGVGMFGPVKYVGDGKGRDISNSENAIGFRYLARLANYEIGPLITYLGMEYNVEEMRIPDVFEQNYRNIENVFANASGTFTPNGSTISEPVGKIKWRGEFGDVVEQTTWWNKYFKYYSKLYGWNLT